MPHIIPAKDGFFVLDPESAGEYGVFYHDHPVIAWAISDDCAVTPISVRGLEVGLPYRHTHTPQKYLDGKAVHDDEIRNRMEERIAQRFREEIAASSQETA